MNYLAHAFLSFGDPDLLTGNMIADHVKGKAALAAFPERIREGILLHRKIDAFTDVHPATQRAKVWFREDYRLYAGPILDSLFDHFLANDPKCFLDEAGLMTFTQTAYTQLEERKAWFPPAFDRYFPHMREHNWLYNYRNLKGMQRSLQGLERRAAHMPPATKAYETFIGYYYGLNQCYYELMDNLIPYVKSELTG